MTGVISIILTLLLYSVVSLLRIKKYHIKKILKNMNPIQRYEHHRKHLTKKEIKRLRSMPYDQYLQTTHWKLCRRAALHRDKHQCRDCWDDDNLQVHHLTYIRRGSELLHDVITVCDKCHRERHKNDKKLHQ